MHIVEKKPTNEALDDATIAGIQAAYGVVHILASEASTTTEGYRGNMVGNKDPERPTDVPEAFMYYDQEANTLGFSAVQMYDGKTGKATNESIKSGAHKSKFSSMMITFDIAPGNPITKVNRQLQVGDFREALADNTLTLKAANGSWFDKDNVDVPGFRDYDILVNGKNVTTKLDEDGDGMSIDDVDARVNNTPQINRIRQVLGATIEDFKADLK